MNNEEIKTIIETYRNERKMSYEKWCIMNPGYIMMNDAIRVACCGIILTKLQNIDGTDNYINYLENYIVECEEKSKTIKSMNGFWIYAETIRDILTIIKKEND